MKLDCILQQRMWGKMSIWVFCLKMFVDEERDLEKKKEN